MVQDEIRGYRAIEQISVVAAEDRRKRTDDRERTRVGSGRAVILAAGS